MSAQKQQIILNIALMIAGVWPSFGSATDSAVFCKNIALLAQSDDHEVALHLPNDPAGPEAICTTSLSLSGGSARNCHWTFPYRSDAAKDAFARVTTRVADCLGPDVTQSTDQHVNHPDAYDLRLFTVADREFAVSLKDKGALQQSLIFVRIPIEATS